jgi:flagellar hook assembly protein FlgD
MPKSFALHQNYPNPFNSQTIIKYDLPKASNVQITIYNILGQQVNNLVNREQPAGFHQTTWDGTNVQGKTVASGVYLYRITAEGFTQSKKMVLLK